jgi:hypothetical protein
LSLCRISFKLGDLIGQTISFRLQQRIFDHKIIYLSLQRGLVSGRLSSNS